MQIKPDLPPCGFGECALTPPCTGRCRYNAAAKPAHTSTPPEREHQRQMTERHVDALKFIVGWLLLFVALPFVAGLVYGSF
jgi:hypothetical protein